MHADTQKLLGYFIGGTIAAVFFFTSVPKAPKWVDGLVSAVTGGGHHGDDHGDDHGKAQGDAAHAPTADAAHGEEHSAATTTPATPAAPSPEAAAKAAKAAEHEKHIQIYAALFVFLGIASAVIAGLALLFFLWTVVVLEKRRGETAAAH